MSTEHFAAVPEGRACKHCVWYVRMVAPDTAECSNPSCSPVRSQASRGCTKFEREPGTDDEPQTQKGPAPPGEG